MPYPATTQALIYRVVPVGKVWRLNEGLHDRSGVLPVAVAITILDGLTGGGCVGCPITGCVGVVPGCGVGATVGAVVGCVAGVVVAAGVVPLPRVDDVPGPVWTRLNSNSAISATTSAAATRMKIRWLDGWL